LPDGRQSGCVDGSVARLDQLRVCGFAVLGDGDEDRDARLGRYRAHDGGRTRGGLGQNDGLGERARRGAQTSQAEQRAASDAHKG
jgi:hypothetical protein